MTKGKLVGASVVVFIVVIALGYFSYVSPGTTLENIKKAAQQDDKERLRDLIDFDQVKTGLKEDIKAQLVSSAGESLKDNPFAALGMAMAAMIVDPMVDMMVSPAGLTALINKGRVEPSVKSKGPTESASPRADSIPNSNTFPSKNSIEAQNSQDGIDIERGYDDFSRYRVRIRPARKSTADVLTLTLRRDGLFSWKLTRISLPTTLFADMRKNGNESPARAQRDASPALSQEQISSLVGMYPSQAVEKPELAEPLKRLIGDRWEDFSQGLSTASEVTEKDGFIFGSGCAPHLCSEWESAFTIERATGSISVVVLNDRKWAGWGFKSAKDDIRGPMRNWAIEHGVIEVDCVEIEKLGLTRPDCQTEAKGEK